MTHYFVRWAAGNRRVAAGEAPQLEEITRWQYDALRAVGGETDYQLLIQHDASPRVEQLESRRLFSSAPAGDLPWIYLPDGWLYVPGDLKAAGEKVASTCAEG